MGEASFGALLVNDVDAIDPAVLTAIQAAADGGVPVIWLGAFPARAVGLIDAARRDAAVATLVDSLRQGVTSVVTVEEMVSALLSEGVTPALGPLSSEGSALSLTHRRVADGDLYYLFNESYEARNERLRMPSGFTEATLFDPDTGQEIRVSIDGDILSITLRPARGALLHVKRGHAPTS